MADKDDGFIPPRPKPPEPYATPDQVAPGFRRLAGYSWRILVIGLLVYYALQLFAPLQTLVLALFFALLIAAWLMPLTNLLDRWMPRWIAVVLSLLAFFATVVLVVVFIGLAAASRWEGVGRAFRDGVLGINEWLKSGPLALTDADITAAYDSFLAFLRESGGNIALGVLQGLGSVLGVATAFAAAAFILLFVLLQPGPMFRWFSGWIPERNRVTVSTSLQIGWSAFSQYSRGILLVAATNAVIVTIALLILQVPFAVPLGVIVFFGTFIPYIGAPIAMFLAAFVAFVSNGLLAGLIVLALIFLVGQLEGNVLHPLIMGRTVNLHPVSIVLATAVFTAFFGILGALLAVPVSASIYGIARYLSGRHDEAESA